MENKFSKITNRDEWRGLLGKVLFKTFFHNIEWEEFLGSQFKWLKFERYNWQNQALVSLARAGDKLISHPFCEYGGPLPLVERVDCEEFKQDLFTEFRNHVRISFHPRLFDYFHNGARSVLVPSERVSYFVEGQLNLRKTSRHEIEKAKQNNIEIAKCNDHKELQVFYRLHLKNAKKHMVPAYPISFFEYFLDSPNAEIILAKYNGKIIAGSVFLFYDKFVHYFQNAAGEKHKNFGANYLILWEQIQKCLAAGKTFDFGGTRVGSSLRIFKQGWGGKEQPILELRDARFDPAKAGSNLKILRNVFGVLPLFLIRKISPHLLKYKL